MPTRPRSWRSRRDRPGDAPAFTTRKVADADWVRLTQSQFEPIHIGKNIWVVPSWHEAPDPNGLILEVDPGLAFGTGSHPTTRLCMEWLEAHPAPGKSVLDYGCGSGILAMVAKKLGAGDVAGVDIDPQAIESAASTPSATSCEIEFYVPDDFVASKHAAQPLRHRGRQHPVEPPEADGADAVRPRRPAVR
jgi:ribosomal protein L11 methyltransferase